MSSAMEAVDEFEVFIKGIQVKDYGDFKRKANTYLERLRQDLAKTSVPAATAQTLEEIRYRLVYKPVEKIEPTRSWILNRTQELREKLK